MKPKPIQQWFGCLCLWGRAFSRILNFGVHTGTNINLFSSGLVVYVYVMVLLVVSSTLVYKQTPKTNLFSKGLVFYVYGVVLLVAYCTSVFKQAPNKPI